MKTVIDVSGHIQKEVRKTSKLLTELSSQMNEEMKHDLRVSIRKIRSVLKVLKDNGVKPFPKNKSVKLRKLWRRLGEARDQDVINDLADTYQIPLPGIQKSQKKADKELSRQIHKPSIQRLLKSFKKLSKNNSLREVNFHPSIVRLRNELLENSKRQEDLHAFRITLKNVRYVLEAMNFNVDEFKKYQDVLGEVNDLKTFLSFSNSFERIRLIHEEKKQSAFEIVQAAKKFALKRLAEAERGALMKFDTYIFDYADVISLPQDLNDFFANADMLGIEHKSFADQYWRFRRAYDLGQKGEVYWRQVAGKELSEDMIRKLIDHDCRSWLRINQETIELIKILRASGKKLVLLSNLPLDLVRRIRQEFHFLDLFDRVFFSAEIHKVKPDEDIYRFVLEEIQEDGRDVLFFDDKEENLKGASKVGINTYLFTPESAQKLLQEIRGS